MTSPILLIEDDRELCSMLSDYLEPESFEVEAVHDGAVGVENAINGDYELVVLDVGLPGMGGFEVLKRIRQTGDLPVLMLTGRGDDVDRILGLEMGADDYLSKPFIPRELVARIKTILRRTRAALEKGDSRKPGTVEVENLVLNVGAREALVEGAPVELTSSEYSVLERLARFAGFVVSREELAEDVLGKPFHPLDRSVDMHISNLRRKLGKNSDGDERIRTIRGEGYMLCMRA